MPFSSGPPCFDMNEPIPPYFSRHPKRSPQEIQALMNKSKQTAAAGTRLLRQAAHVAKLVKHDEAWIKKYSAERHRLIPGANTKRAAAVAAASVIAATSSFTRASALAAAAETGGYSNTNHAVPWNVQHDSNKNKPPKPDVESNRVRELIRNRLNRLLLEQPEARTEERWDKPKVVGERRRRIVRDKDAPQAPLEPPTSGYNVFIFLMTTKIRHDKGPDAEHSQTAVVQEISRLWRVHLKDTEQQYYNKMAEEIQNEYREQMLEFRATDEFRPSERYVKLGDGKGPWVHKNAKDRNQLEAEIASYETVIFPPRPASKDKEFHERERQSIERRKERLRKEADEKYARKRALEEALLKEGKLNRRISRRRVKRKTTAKKEDDNDDGGKDDSTVPGDDSNTGHEETNERINPNEEEGDAICQQEEVSSQLDDETQVAQGQVETNNTQQGNENPDDSTAHPQATTTSSKDQSKDEEQVIAV